MTAETIDNHCQYKLYWKIIKGKYNKLSPVSEFLGWIHLAAAMLMQYPCLHNPCPHMFFRKLEASVRGVCIFLQCTYGNHSCDSVGLLGPTVSQASGVDPGARAISLGDL